MKQSEILKKAIEKATENGFGKDWYYRAEIEGVKELKENNVTLNVYYAEPEAVYEKHICLFEIIFSHEFAKAFWGEEKAKDWFKKQGKLLEDRLWNGWVDDKGDYWSYLGDEPIWKYQLQQLVLKENPLEYIKRFLG